MMENDFEVIKEESTLKVVLGKELAAENSPKVIDAISRYYGQGIKKVVFDATGLTFLSSAGVRVLFFVGQRFGTPAPEITMVNCAKEIYKVLNLVGVNSFVKFKENEQMKKDYRRRALKDVGKDDFNQLVTERKEALDHYESNNDVVCYSMKIGKDD